MTPQVHLTFVTVLRASSNFGPEAVLAINRQARKHLAPDRIVCFSDVPVEDGCERFPLVNTWPGWWAKIEMFRADAGLSGLCVFFDLDTLLLRPVDFRAKLATPGKGNLWMLADLGTPSRSASGVMAWHPSPDTAQIYAKFAAKPDVLMRTTRHGDGGWISQFPHERLQPVFPDVFRSYKYDKLHAGPRDTTVCCFHGYPKPWDCQAASWVRKEWEGGE